MQYLVLILLVFPLISCSSRNVQPEQTQAQPVDVVKPQSENTGMLFLFNEKNGDEPERPLRLIITKSHLRIDEGFNSKDFILFDRSQQAIYNVVAEDKSVLVIHPKTVEVKPSFTLRWLVESQVSSAIAKSHSSQSSTATHYQYFLNDIPCYNVVVVDDFAGDYVDVLREYRTVLAQELKQSYHTSGDHECFDAVNIFEPNITLQYGMPLREWSGYGYQRFLINYKKEVEFPANLFKLPEDYQQYSTPFTTS